MAARPVQSFPAGRHESQEMNHQVILPELGEGIETATVACWHVRTGQAVAPEDEVVELVTDKATFTVTAAHGGVVAKILAAEGADVRVGDPLAEISDS